MDRYYENHKSFEYDKDGWLAEPASNWAWESDCRKSYEKRTGMKYENAPYDECNLGNIYAAQAARRANEAAGTAGRTSGRLFSQLKNDQGIDFDTFQPSTTQSSPSEPTIRSSKHPSHSSSRATFTPTPPDGGGMPPLLSPSIHILALLTATTITLIRHRELARFALYWLARAAGIDLAAWPSAVHLLPAALCDTIPATVPDTRTTSNTTKPTTPEPNTRRRGAASWDGTRRRGATTWDTTNLFTGTRTRSYPDSYPSSYRPYSNPSSYCSYPNSYPSSYPPNLPYPPFPTSPTSPTTTTTTTTPPTRTPTRTPPSRYWATLHALRWQEGLAEPVLSSLQAWYIASLLVLVSTCGSGTGEAILAAVWTALLWPVLQVYLLAVVVTSGVRWAPELLWFGREVVWFVVLAVGAAVVQVVGVWVGVVRANWVVLFVAWAGWVTWGLVTRVDHGEVAEGTVGWVLYRSAGLLYWAGDVVRDVARGVMSTA